MVELIFRNIKKSQNTSALEYVLMYQCINTLLMLLYIWYVGTQLNYKYINYALHVNQYSSLRLFWLSFIVSTYLDNSSFLEYLKNDLIILSISMAILRHQGYLRDYFFSLISCQVPLRDCDAKRDYIGLRKRMRDW